MGEKEGFKQLVNYALIIGLFIIAFLVIRPIAFAIIYGILLAFIFHHVYRLALKVLRYKTLSAVVVCFGVVAILLTTIYLILGSLLTQVVNFYLILQTIDIRSILEQVFPAIISNSDISSVLANSINISISKILANSATGLGNFVLNLPSYILQLLVIFLVFFFGLRDGESAFEYFQSLSHLKKETQNKFFTHFKSITHSVIIGEIIVGLVQGLVAGVGYFIFGVPNALLLTVLTMVVSIIPIVGPWLIWIPVDVYLFVNGDPNAGLGLLVYGLLLVNWIDAVLRPMIVSRNTELNTVIVLVGMIGGLQIFGILGLIIGPLTLAYVLLVAELYRKNLNEPVIFKKEEDEEPILIKKDKSKKKSK